LRPHHSRPGPLLLHWVGREDRSSPRRIAHPTSSALNRQGHKTEALIRLPRNIVRNHGYPLSPGIMAMREILGQLRPEPSREAPAPATAVRAAERGTLLETRLAPEP